MRERSGHLRGVCPMNLWSGLSVGSVSNSHSHRRFRRGRTRLRRCLDQPTAPSQRRIPLPRRTSNPRTLRTPLGRQMDHRRRRGIWCFDQVQRRTQPAAGAHGTEGCGQPDSADPSSWSDRRVAAVRALSPGTVGNLWSRQLGEQRSANARGLRCDGRSSGAHAPCRVGEWKSACS